MSKILKPLFSLIQKDFLFLTYLQKFERLIDIITFIYFKFLTKDGLVLRRINNYLIYLDLRTKGISQILFFSKQREILETEIVRKEIQRNFNCLDIGANIGYYSLLEAKLISDENVVYSIEPDKRNIILLKKNIKVNSLKNVEVFNLAISNEDKLSIMNLSEESNLNTLVTLTEEEKNTYQIIKSVPIKTLSIDSFLKGKRPVNFIRMDIEGFEYEALEGMVELLENQKEEIKIMIEFHPKFYYGKRDFALQLKKLENHGFNVKYIISAEKVYHDLITQRGYAPIKIVTEREYTRGLYENIKMTDLIDFIKSEKKIVRAGLFTRSAIE